MDILNESALRRIIREEVQKEIKSSFSDELFKATGLTRKDHMKIAKAAELQRAFNQKEAASRLGIHPTGVYNLVKEGELHPKVQGTRRYYLKEDIDDYLDRGR